MSNPNPNKKGLHPKFSSTNQPANRGRKKSKLKAFVVENDMNANDISNLAKMVLDKKHSELLALAKDETLPMLARLFVRLFLEDWKTAKYDNLSKILERAVGTVKQEIEHSGGVDLGPAALSNEELDELIKKYDQS